MAFHLPFAAKAPEALFVLQRVVGHYQGSLQHFPCSFHLSRRNRSERSLAGAKASRSSSLLPAKQGPSRFFVRSLIVLSPSPQTERAPPGAGAGARRCTDGGGGRRRPCTGTAGNGTASSPRQPDQIPFLSCSHLRCLPPSWRPGSKAREGALATEANVALNPPPGLCKGCPLAAVSGITGDVNVFRSRREGHSATCSERQSCLGSVGGAM